MMQSFDDMNKYGKEIMDNGLKSFSALSRNAQAITAEATEFSKKSIEEGSAAIEKLMSVKSFDKAVEVQTDYARKAYEGFVAQATRMGDLYAEMAKDAYKPFESAIARTS